MTSRAGKVAVRDISPMLQAFRRFLLGRDPVNPLRFEQGVASRNGPDANLKPGPAHKVAANYYFSRDARREVQFPTPLAENSKAAATKAIISEKPGIFMISAAVIPSLNSSPLEAMARIAVGAV